MKKLIYVVAILSFMCAGSAFATETFTATGPAGTVTGILVDYKTSTNVALVVDSTVSQYAAVSSHLNGDRVFGSSSTESVIYELDARKTPGTSYTTAPGATLDFASSADWSSL